MCAWFGIIHILLLMCLRDLTSSLWMAAKIFILSIPLQSKRLDINLLLNPLCLPPAPSAYIHQEKPQLAQSALEQAVSANFAVGAEQ